MTTAWVLRGGASFGAAQVGMARALMEAGHHPDRLYGASAGALNAAWLAADPTTEGVVALGRLWSIVRRRDVFPISLLVGVAGLAGMTDHLVRARALARWLRSTALLPRLEDGALPLAVMATDLETGEEVVMDRGPTVPALLASSAMPGVFPPVRTRDRWLIDGSVVSDTPIGPAVRAGADRVFVLPSVPTGAVRRPSTVVDVLLRSTALSLARHNDEAVAAWAGRCELYLVPAPGVPGVSPFNFDRSQDLITAAYRLAATWAARARPVAPTSEGAVAAHVARGQKDADRGSGDVIWGEPLTRP
jgi:NTE family protein